MHLEVVGAFFLNDHPGVESGRVDFSKELGDDDDDDDDDDDYGYYYDCYYHYCHDDEDDLDKTQF